MPLRNDGLDIVERSTGNCQICGFIDADLILKWRFEYADVHSADEPEALRQLPIQMLVKACAKCWENEFRITSEVLL